MGEPLFDDIYYYESSDLGSSYRRDRTKFKIWTPVAKYMKLELVDKNGNNEVVPMEYDNQGVWYLRLRGDYEGYKYRYISYVNGQEHHLTDPYGRSSSTNGEYSYVIDEAKLYKQRTQRPKFTGNYSDAIIYEAHVRDFTIQKELGARFPGKYKSFTEEGLTTPGGLPAGMDHLKDLGITHVQLMPVYDFGDVDEANPDKKYNWGYNPEQYNVPEGWYSTNPEDPYARINELKELIDDLHAQNLRVNMDVVFNHVWDIKTFPFEKIVPGYGFRHDEQGMITNSSGCNNDLATERLMIRKFVIDSVMYWAKEYKIDGFRFDLMGLIDIRTMNTLRQKLDRFRSDMMVYGEGWQMSNTIGYDLSAHMYNRNLLFNIAHFNDKTRERIKGATFRMDDLGYAFGSNSHLNDIKNIIMGSAVNKFLFRYPIQSINYVECHDNNTFYDKAAKALKNVSEEERLKRQRLALSMVILSQGIPFIHAGQEFYRSKQGVENSYRHSDEINQIDWSLVDKHSDDIEYLRELLRLRRKYDLFRLKAPSKIKEYVEVHIQETGTIIYKLKDLENELLVIFKNNTHKETIELDGRFTLIFDGKGRSRRILTKINVEDITTYI